MSYVLDRVTFSNYANLGLRVNYFKMNYNIVLTKQKDNGKIRGVIDNAYVLGVF